MKRETVSNRQYTDEFKLEALRLAESVGVNQAAKRLGIPGSSLGMAPTQAQREIDSGPASDGNQALAGGAGGGEPSVAARAGQYQA